MFRSQEMSRVELIVPERDVVHVTQALADSGAFHPVLTERLGEEHVPARGANWYEQAAALASLEQRILAVMKPLAVDEGLPPQAPPALVEPDIAQLDVARLEQEIQAPVRELEEDEARLSQMQRYVSQLQTVANLDVDLERMRRLRYAFALMGTMPISNLERLQTSLELIPSGLVVLKREEHLATVLLFGAQRDAEILNRAARSAYINPLNLPEAYQGTPAQAIAALEDSITQARQRIAESKSAIAQLQGTLILHLRQLLWQVRATRTLAETIARYGRLRYTYLIAGWTPTGDVAALKQKIKQVSDKALVEAHAVLRNDASGIPVVLKNPPVVRNFQGLVTNYGHPAYDEIDPTPIVALMFPLVFGIMFGDLGQGLLLALLGALLVSRRVRALRGLAGLGTVVIGCGVSAMIFGVLYGSFFGFEHREFGFMFKPVLFSPIEEIINILLITVGIGVALLSLRMVCTMANAALRRRWGKMIFDHNGLVGLLFYWSLIALVGAIAHKVPVSPLVFAATAIISLLGMAFAEVLERLVEGHRPLIEHGWGSFAIMMPIEMFEVLISLMSNTLSYVRMGAFAVAHGALSMVVFIMARIAGGHEFGVVWWIIVVLGNLFIIGFEGLIVSIQTMRLQYYEFFSKFFSGSGARFRPLALVPKQEKQ
jgi:V/A-type H+-transporting ATPase subunit I